MEDPRSGGRHDSGRGVEAQSAGEGGARGGLPELDGRMGWIAIRLMGYVMSGRMETHGEAMSTSPEVVSEWPEVAGDLHALTAHVGEHYAHDMDEAAVARTLEAEGAEPLIAAYRREAARCEPGLARGLAQMSSIEVVLALCIIVAARAMARAFRTDPGLGEHIGEATADCEALMRCEPELEMEEAVGLHLATRDSHRVGEFSARLRRALLEDVQAEREEARR